MAKKNPQCPLCLKEMEQKLIVKFATSVYLCKRCRIFINCNDPCINHWDAASAVECHFCRADMRVFCKQDGYMKAFCPKCKSVQEIQPDYEGADPGKLDFRTCPHVNKVSTPVPGGKDVMHQCPDCNGSWFTEVEK